MKEKQPTKDRQDRPPNQPKTLPDAWERFERAVDVVIKSPPKHKAGKKPRKPKRKK